MGAATSNISDSTSSEDLTTQTPTLSQIPLPATERSSQSGLVNDRLLPSSRSVVNDTGQEDTALQDGFKLEGVHNEDLMLWSQAAPEGQRLETNKSQKKMASSECSSSMLVSSKPVAVQPSYSDNPQIMQKSSSG